MDPLFSAPSTSETTLTDTRFAHDRAASNGPPKPPPSPAGSEAPTVSASSSSASIPVSVPAPLSSPSPSPTPSTPIDLQRTILVEDGHPGQPAAAPGDPAHAQPTRETPAAGASAAAATQGQAPAQGQTAAPAPAPASALTPAAARALRRKRRRRRAMISRLLPAWSVSLIVHLVIFVALGAATFSDVAVETPVNIDTALGGLDRVMEETPILADPADQRLDELGDSRDLSAPAAQDDELWADERPDQGGVIATVALPTPTPTIRGVVAGDAERRLGSAVGLADLKRSPISQIPAAALSSDLYGGGNFGGDPTFGVGDTGEALNQLAHEILNHLVDHKVTVVWLLDESSSMSDDQREIAKEFDRVSSELNRFVPADKKAAGALNHALVGFGEKVHVLIDKPTTNADVIRDQIARMPIDETGIENTMRAIRESVGAFSRVVSKERKMLLVLATDESGDDGAEVEQTLEVLKKYNVPLYVLGRQAIFGYPYAHLKHVDKVTNDVYYPTIRRGPETVDVEIFQWDGLYDRWDEKPSGFAPWELARLARDSGGIYFLLPTEEGMRLHETEKTYSISQLKEYMPEYLSRDAYTQRRTESDLRRHLHLIVSATQDPNFRYRREFPIDPAGQIQAALEEGPKATIRLNDLIDLEERLKALKKHRDREPLRRWRAHYDLMLAQVVVFQIKAYEYRALMAQLAREPRKPSKAPSPNLAITFVVDHAPKGLAPETETAERYAEANKLLNNVIAEYPNTPWADLAKDALTRGFSVVLNQWEHSPNYKERESYVPKY